MLSFFVIESNYQHALLSRGINNFNQYKNTDDTIIFDRGIADNIAYAKLFNLDLAHYENAAQYYQYNKKVFFLPAWEAIYENDSERKMTFKQAKLFGDDVCKTYQKSDYQIIDVPKVSPEERVMFIIKEIKS